MPDIGIDQLQSNAAIKVAIVEDLREVREGLAMLINGTGGFLCVGSFRSMEEAIAKLSRQKPDIVLTDIGLPGMDGIEGIKVLPRTISRSSLSCTLRL